MAEIHDLVDENDIDCQRKVYMYMWVNIRMVYIMTNKAHVVQLEESLCVKGRTSVCKSPFVFPPPPRVASSQTKIPSSVARSQLHVKVLGRNPRRLRPWPNSEGVCVCVCVCVC